MNTEDNGGPAFPTENQRQTGYSTFHFSGMSLLDWFAGQAQDSCPVNAHEHDKSAEWCYARADAMLRAKIAREVLHK